MNVLDIVENLQGGELRNHPWFINDTVSTIGNNSIIRAIDVCMTDLYTRFPILTDELTIIQNSGLTQYWLLPQFAKSNVNSFERIKYIDDTVEAPFTGNVLRVESIQDEDGNDLTLNSNAKCLVAFTPAPELVEVPNPVDTNALFVVYRTRPPKLTTLDTEFLLPEQFRPALLAYVAYRAYSGMTDPQANNLAMMNFQKYEMLCAQYIHTGMVNADDNLSNDNFSNGGWI